MLNVLSLPDARDWLAVPYEARDYRARLDVGVQDLRIAYSPDLGYAKVDPEVAALVRDAVRVFETLGARVDEKNPGFPDAEPVFAGHWFPGATYLLSGIPDEKKKLMDPGLVALAEEGKKFNAHQVLDAQQKRNGLGLQMSLFHRDYDLLVTPTLAVPAFDVGKECPEGFKRWTDWTPFSFPFNLTGQPAASIPCGFTKAGLPVGLHIVGPRYADALVLRAARAFESVRPLPSPDLDKLRRK
jgi:aspartyl-tRNA(Asn)/glutamyl-tRNA(Gln) amidotransferase subunit A